MKSKKKKKPRVFNDKNSPQLINALRDVNPVFSYLIVLLLPFITLYFYFDYSFEKNHFLSFPLDDPWIHLTFAKNLSEYFSFSYFKDEMVTAGSTSPLYTLILAAGFFFYKNEMMLSYLLSAVFFSLSAFYFLKLSNIEFGKRVLFALAVTCVFVLDKWMNFIALSGMETMLFILFLIVSAYFFKTKTAVPFAVASGLLIWIRPDGIAFIAALIVTYFIELFLSKNKPEIKLFGRNQLIKICGIFIFLTAAYFLFNYALCGSILPNTYTAKIAYFIDNEKRLNFLVDAVWEYFTDGYYSVIMFGFILSSLKFVYDLFRKSYNHNTLYITFILIFVLIYTVKLPAVNRFGRYVMPLIPFFILVSMIGYKDLFELIAKLTGNKLLGNVMYFILIPAVIYFSFNDYQKNKADLARHNKHIYDRQVKTAYWLKDNTDTNDIVATHDIGAIGFYSGRKLVDVAGLVNNELNEKLNEYDYSQIITDYCKKHNVSYLVFLAEWYSVSNQIPIFSAPPDMATKEIMSVFKFLPDKTHILSKEAHNLMSGLGKELKNKNAEKILAISGKVINLEPKDSYAYYFRAIGYLLKKDYANYEKNIIQSISLFPDFVAANLNYANFLFSEKRFVDAVKYYSVIRKLEPFNREYEHYLKTASDSAINKNPNKNEMLNPGK